MPGQLKYTLYVLTFVVELNHKVIIMKLAEAGADINLATMDGNTPLHEAVKGDLEAVAILLKFNPLITRNQMNKTALDLAETKKHIHQLLIEYQKHQPITELPKMRQPSNKKSLEKPAGKSVILIAKCTFT